VNFLTFLKIPQKVHNTERGPEPSWFVKLFASGLYSGYIPAASGTAGSLVAILLYYFIPPLSNSHLLLLTAAVTFVLGVQASGIMEKYYGHDPAEVTIDEVVGMWIALLFLPKNILIMGISFLAFRLFDIMKPYPANRFDAMHGGIGIMMDDVVCGLYANLIVQALIYSHLFSLLEHGI
jgi:phosphatidylglycerophosphatase A